MVTVAEKYGYGTLAVFIVSLLGLLGIVILPCAKKEIYNKLLIVLTGLAISTMFCDAMLHIIPEILAVESASSDVITVPTHIIRIIVVIIALYLLWLFEILITKFLGGYGHGHTHGHSHNVKCEEVAYSDKANNKICNQSNSTSFNIEAEAGQLSQQTIPPRSNTEETSEAGLVTSSNASTPVNNEIEVNPTSNTNRIQPSNAIVGQKKKEPCLNVKLIKPAAWMLIVSDFIHNLCDGLAIGASFSQSISLGISTTIAVVFHEIPHEIGNYAVLVQFGFKHWQALLINFGTTFSCFIGFYIGASISTDDDSTRWILSITAGMFLYIALVELMPQLPFTNPKEWSWPLFILVNLFMLLGFAIMFLLVIFEDKIQVA